jgi:peptidoglycan hydrolase CwlO-like protein
MKKIRSRHLFIFFLVVIIPFASITFSKAQDVVKFDSSGYRDAIAIFEENLLSIADKEQGSIGEQLRGVTETQNEIKNNVISGVEKIQKRSKMKKFLIGTDDKNIGQLLGEITKTDNQIGQLKRLLKRVIVSEEGKIAIGKQIIILEEENQKIVDFLKVNNSNFSLFGWFLKII